MTQSWTLFQWRQRTKEEQTETFDSLSLSSSRDVLGIKTKIRHGGARRHEDGKKFLKSKRGEKATEMDCFIHGNRFLLHFPFFVSFPSVRFFKCPDRLTSSSTGKECPFLPFVFFRFKKTKVSFFPFEPISYKASFEMPWTALFALLLRGGERLRRPAGRLSNIWRPSCRCLDPHLSFLHTRLLLLLLLLKRPSRRSDMYH